MTGGAWAFVGLSMGLLAFGGLALLRIGMLRLEMPIGIERDGIRVGRFLPPWRRVDLHGRIRALPRGIGWQVLVFAAHSLEAFPDLIEGLATFAEIESDLEVLVLSQAPPAESSTLRRVGVTAPIVSFRTATVPIAKVDVRVASALGVDATPYYLGLDSDGRIRSREIAETADGLEAAIRELPARARLQPPAASVGASLTHAGHVPRGSEITE